MAKKNPEICKIMEHCSYGHLAGNTQQSVRSHKVGV